MPAAYKNTVKKKDLFRLCIIAVTDPF
jgi:hypothetical protein